MITLRRANERRRDDAASRGLAHVQPTARSGPARRGVRSPRDPQRASSIARRRHPASPASRCRDPHLRPRGRARVPGFDGSVRRRPRGRVPAHDRRTRRSPQRDECVADRLGARFPALAAPLRGWARARSGAETLLRGGAPGWLCVVASPDARSGSLRLRQDALLYSAMLDPGDHVVHELSQGRSTWLHLVEGEASFRDIVLSTGDGAGVTAEHAVSLTAREETEILLLDLGEPTSKLPKNEGAP